MLWFLLLSSFLGAASSSFPLVPTTFSLSSFNRNSCTNGELICMGSATAGDGYLSITPDLEQGSGTSQTLPFNQVGRVLYTHPVDAWPATLSTTFTVRISAFPNSTGSGDGMAFVFAQDSGPSPPGSYGPYLGLFNSSTEGGVVRQLAVELDTFKNGFDPDGNHIAIDTTSVRDPVAAISLNNAGIDLKSGRNIKVKIDYNGLDDTLHVSVGYSGTALVTVLSHKIITSDMVPASVFVGFTASTGGVSESHHLIDWMFTSVPMPFHHDGVEEEKIKNVLITVTPIFFFLLMVGICIFPLVLGQLKKKNQRIRTRDDIEIQSRTAANIPKTFTYKHLSKATQEFSKENLLGRGGFGSVYKGTVLDPPMTIAVKKISATSKQGEREYMAEICTIGRLRHKNILQLHGWCHDGKHLLLVYEYMPNGSLDRFIGKGFLDWETRLKIVTGLASALLYLHEECGNPVVHRDIKPSNVLLDSDYNAHLGDFGLARLLQNEASVTTMFAGTPGYLAPEVGFTGKATKESDVYSFGMVVLEVVCGKRSRGIMEDDSLVDSVWVLYGQNALLECVDQKLKGRFDEEQVKRMLTVGLACLHPDSTFRPTIRKVVHVLSNPNEPLMDLPAARPDGVYISLSSSSATTTTTYIASRSCAGLLP